MLMTSVRFAWRLIGTLGVLHFLFILALTEHVSGLSVALFAACAVAALPPVRRRISQLPVLGRDWVFGCAFLILILAANLLLASGNRPEIVRGKYAFAHATLISGELGTTWFCLVRRPREAAHVLGKLLLAVGDDNLVWGTDSIWYGPPQPVIDAFRAFRIPESMQSEFGYPALTPERKAKILSRNGDQCMHYRYFESERSWKF